MAMSAFVVMLLSVLLSSCGVSLDGSKAADEVFVAESSEQIADALAGAVNMRHFVKLGEESLPLHFGFDKTLFDDFAVYISSVQGSTDEVAVFHLNSSEYEGEVVSALSAKAAQKNNTFASYDAEAGEKRLEDNCLVFSSSDYVIMVVSDKVNSAKNTISSFYVESEKK